MVLNQFGIRLKCHFFLAAIQPPYESCRHPLDIVFVVARSTSDVVWDAMKQFAVAIASSIAIGPNGANFGAITFGSTAQSQFFLNTFSNQAGVVAHLNSMVHPNRYQGYSLLSALQLLLSEQFILQNGDRLNACNVAIIIIDCHSYMDQHEYNQIAAKLQEKGISLVPVGVDSGHNKESLSYALQLMARPPKTRENNYYLVERLTDFQGYVPTLITYICNDCCVLPTQIPSTSTSKSYL